MNGVALEYFNGLSPPDITVEIDASDYGLCALDVSSKCALTYQFIPEERKVVAEFKATGDNGIDINYREFLSCVFAVHAWVSAGRTKHRKGRDRFTFTFASTTGQQSSGKTKWHRATRKRRWSSDYLAGGRRRSSYDFPPLASLELTICPRTLFTLRAEAISVVDEQGDRTSAPGLAYAVWVKLRGSKTNQRGSATVRKLHRSGHEFVCPVLGALPLLQARKNLPQDIPAAVYLSAHGIPASVSTKEFASAIKKAATELGNDASTFSSHSLRAGGPTHLYRAGADAMTIQFHGRWASEAFKSYTRLCSESVSSLSGNMMRGSKGDSRLR
ncbi:hypothetical protein ON010_g15052 [Phytophthora cinnamomi]|nr:hypothetical protein ON010_g15052 [Phytophthora cinnamomi]